MDAVDMIYGCNRYDVGMDRVLHRDVLGIIKGCTGYHIGMHGVL
jgi:hypothetical protein